MFKKISPKLRIFCWFLSGIVRKYFLLITISFISSILLFLLIKSVYPVLRPILNPANETIAIIGEYTPSTLPLSVQSLISSGLTSVTLEGSAAAGLATEWTISEDGKIYTFSLQKGVKWHDNTEFSAKDINYNLKDAIIVPKSDYEFEVRLKESYVPLPILLAKPLFKRGLIGLGSYKVKSIKLNGDIVEYLFLTPVNSVKPNITFRFYSNEEKAITAFKLGEVDEITEMTDPKDLKDWNNVSVSEKVLLNRYVGIFLNTKNDLFKDKDLRQTLNLATSSFYGEKPTGSISPLSWAYYPKVKIYDQNLPFVKQKLPNTVLATSSAKITISTFQNLYPVASKIVDEWKNTGINADIKLENTLPSDYQVLLATQEIPPDPDQYPFWHSTQTTSNITNLSNPKIDKLLEDGRITNSLDERLKIYADFQRFLAEESPVIFLYYPRVYSISRK